MKNTAKKVWVGFSDGKPHVFMSESMKVHATYPRNVAVYPTKWEAKIDYEDARPAYLVWPVKPKRKTRR